MTALSLFPQYSLLRNLYGVSDIDISKIADHLSAFPLHVLEFVSRKGAQVIPLGPGVKYSDASPALKRLCVDMDAWPAPPAGLFVVEERTVYMRSFSPMTICHEFSHALDCALGDGIYLSSFDPELRGMFSEARRFVTPYAATSIDEWFAECCRAYVEKNDEASFWPKATKARLMECDAAMFRYVENLFGDIR